MAASPVDFYFDLFSPYGYLGSTQVEALAARHHRSVEWRPVLLGVTVIKIMGLKAIPATPLKGPYGRIDAPRLAQLFGVPFRFHDLPGLSSLNGMRAFMWLKARDPALAARFAHRMYARLWVRGEDITPPEASADEAAALGIDRAELLAAIETQAVKDALKDAVDAAVARGVFGVPTFIVDDQPIWGSDRLWMLEHWLRQGNWDPPVGR